MNPFEIARESDVRNLIYINLKEEISLISDKSESYLINITEKNFSRKIIKYSKNNFFVLLINFFNYCLLDFKSIF